MLKKILQIAPLVLAGAVGVYLFYTYRVPPKLQPQEWQLTNLNGKEVNADLWQGKPVVINFWATWCGTCLQEMPKLNKAAPELFKEGFNIVCISDEDPAKLNRYQNKTGYPFLFLHSKVPLTEYGVHSYPTTYILNANNRVIVQRAGSILPFDDERFIERILKETR